MQPLTLTSVDSMAEACANHLTFNSRPSPPDPSLGSRNGRPPSRLHGCGPALASCDFHDWPVSNYCIWQLIFNVLSSLHLNSGLTIFSKKKKKKKFSPCLFTSTSVREGCLVFFFSRSCCLRHFFFLFPVVARHVCLLGSRLMRDTSSLRLVQ